MSLDSLLKRSREYVKREKSQQGSNQVHKVSRDLPPETSSDKERRRSCDPAEDTGVEFGFSLHHSPVGAPQSKIQHHVLYNPSPQLSGSLSPSLPDRYAQLPSPESSISPRPQRRRPRPVSTGNIHISFPIGPADLIPRSPGRSGEGAGMAEWGEPFLGTSSLPRSSTGSEGSRCGSRRSSHCGTSPVQEICSPVNASGLSPKGHHEHLVAGFRRRCHTLDSQPPTYKSSVEHIDRSQERLPRFMAGVTWLTPSWRTSAAPLNQSYEVENPSSSLQRPHIVSDLPQVKLRMESDDPGWSSPAVFRNAVEAQSSQTGEWIYMVSPHCSFQL